MMMMTFSPLVQQYTKNGFVSKSNKKKNKQRKQRYPQQGSEKCFP